MLIHCGPCIVGRDTADTKCLDNLTSVGIHSSFNYVIVYMKCLDELSHDNHVTCNTEHLIV